MSKVNQTGDVQSLNSFGLAYSINNSFTNSATKTASASSSTTVTTSGLTLHDSQGCMILANTAADWSGTTLYGVCQDNTTTVVTVDRWYTITGSASGSSPSTSGPFVILPCMAPFWYVALSDSTSAVAGTETGAAMGGTELSSNGLGRQKITSITRTAGSSITYTVTLSTTFTYSTSGSQNIGRAALTNSSVATKNFAYFIDQINSGTPAVVSSNGDTLQIQYTITVG